MSIYNNTSNIRNLYAGTSQVKRVYQGGWLDGAHYPEKKVWEQAPTFWTFGGLNIAPAPLRHNGTSFYIKEFDDWTTKEYSGTSTYSGSMFFSFLDLGRAFSSQGSSFSTSSGNITNTYKTTYAGYSDWRIPTKKDWEGILGSRQGSTINGTSGCRYSIVIVDDYLSGTLSSPTYCYGLLLLPDGVTKTGMSRTFTWNSYTSTHASIAEIYEYTDWGCVFLPGLGYYSSGWSNRGYQGLYQCATSFDSTYNYTMFFNSSSASMNTSIAKKNSTNGQVRLVRGAPGINVVVVINGSVSSANVSIVLKDPIDLSHTLTFYCPVSSSSTTFTGVLQLEGTTFNISSSVVYGSASTIRIVSYNGGNARSGYYSSGSWSGATLTTSNYIFPTDGSLMLNITIS